jgi:superfamily II DNA or RNA helicase
MNIQLRDYQLEGVNAIRERFRAGDRNVLFQLPTGGGKTIVFSYITEGAAKKNNRVLILVHRQELIRQTSASLNDIGVEHGIIAPGFTPSWDIVQVASVQTLVRRLDKIHPPQLIISDECHHAGAASWSKIFSHFNKASILGVTATPVRLDGKGLGRSAGGFFDSMVNGPAVADLIKRGYLATPKVYAPPIGADLSSLRKKYGEFVSGEAAAALDKPVITGCAVEHYRKLCGGVPAIAFCASVAHAEHVADQFRAAGYQAASIDGTMHDNDRKQRIQALGGGALNVLTSCDIISEGTDIPIVGAAILLRPTASTGLYLQQVGRALRMYEGKTHAVILDHVGNVMRHGMPDEDREWSLDGEKLGGKKKKDDEKDIAVKQCDQCYCCHAPAPRCPVCGHVYEVTAREIETAEGQLQEIDSKRLAQIEEKRGIEFRKRDRGMAKTEAELRAVIAEQGGNPDQAYYIMKARGQRGGPGVHRAASLPY